ncbi:aldolase [Paenibacillus oenotherae]|uniref:Aldolase n=1 Tax=Paenibacillus oenotherae TaxID=1435645 RepID=A0ABS7D9W4_9BACL|nr:aldolase [Paenibacillus oenotherae]MBW7476737.1 aldolase [Paenibacillus oenotherae]
MIPSIETTNYEAFGMRIASQLALPELQRVYIDDAYADIEIQYGDLTRVWAEAAIARNSYNLIDGGIIFTIPDTAIFSVEEGKRITVSPMENGDSSRIRLFLLGTCMGILLMQRGVLPLHGSAVIIEGKAYAFVGDSGAGKSTLASAFLGKGYPLVSDDVIAVSLDPDGIPIVTPSYPQQKLWQESIDQLGLAANQYQPLYGRVNKYAIPVASAFHTQPVPLGGVFELCKVEGEETKLCEIERLGRFPLLVRHTYRNALISLLQLEQWHFATSAAVISKIGVYQLQRPSAGFTVQRMAAQILELTRKGVS